MTVIDVCDVSKRYSLRTQRTRTFQQLFLDLFRRNREPRRETLWALRDISFSVDAGETLGIVGSNGSGKSTCLKLLTGILDPTRGRICVRGRVSALLELGAGFHPDLTGRENILLHGSVLGMGRREMQTRLDGIVAFAELERFIDTPVKHYSSGMYVRLAFAAAIDVEPDILLVDEVLAVGDHAFQGKCLARIHELKEKGVTIVLVSHDLQTVARVCDRTIWLDHGLLRDDGSTADVLDRYLLSVQDPGEAHPCRDEDVDRAEVLSDADEDPGFPPEEQPGRDTVAVPCEPKDPPPASGRWGSGEAEIGEVLFLDGDGNRTSVVTVGEPMTVVIRYEAGVGIEDPVFGVSLSRSDGLHMSGSNTHLAGVQIPSIEGAGEVRYSMDALHFLPGTYRVTVAIHSVDEARVYAYHDAGYQFAVQLGAVRERYGTVHVPGKWRHTPEPSAPTCGSQR